MAIRRLLIGAALGVIASFGLPAAVAVAAPAYPPSVGGLTVSASTVTAGGSVSIAGAGFEAGSPVNVTVRVAGVGIVDNFSIVADMNGSIATAVRLTVAGQTTIVVTGVDINGAPRILTTVVEAASAGGSSGGGSASGGVSLPNTGASIRIPLVLGGALLLGGCGAILSTRRRRRRTTAS
jgi:LPXTG-motif cell wall-anchored protein